MNNKIMGVTTGGQILPVCSETCQSRLIAKFPEGEAKAAEVTTEKAGDKPQCARCHKDVTVA